MRNKPAKLYVLIGANSEPYRVGGEVQAYRSSGKALKVSKRLYEKRALLFVAVRAGLTLNEVK